MRLTPNTTIILVNNNVLIVHYDRRKSKWISAGEWLVQSIALIDETHIYLWLFMHTHIVSPYIYTINQNNLTAELSPFTSSSYRFPRRATNLNLSHHPPLPLILLITYFNVHGPSCPTIFQFQSYFTSNRFPVKFYSLENWVGQRRRRPCVWVCVNSYKIDSPPGYRRLVKAGFRTHMEKVVKASQATETSSKSVTNTPAYRVFIAWSSVEDTAKTDLLHHTKYALYINSF